LLPRINATSLQACAVRIPPGKTAHKPVEQHRTPDKLLFECNTLRQHFLKQLQRLKSQQMPALFASRNARGIPDWRHVKKLNVQSIIACARGVPKSD
jgi:hypothetical protein